MYYYRMTSVEERLDALTREIQALKGLFQISYQVNATHLKEAQQDYESRLKFKSDKEIMRDYIDDVYRLKLSRFDDSSDDDSESDDESDDDATYTSDPEVEVDLDEDTPEEGIEPKPETVFEF